MPHSVSVSGDRDTAASGSSVALSICETRIRVGELEYSIIMYSETVTSSSFCTCAALTLVPREVVVGLVPTPHHRLCRCWGLRSESTRVVVSPIKLGESRMIDSDTTGG